MILHPNLHPNSAPMLNRATLPKMDLIKPGLCATIDQRMGTNQPQRIIIIVSILRRRLSLVDHI